MLENVWIIPILNVYYLNLYCDEVTDAACQIKNESLHTLFTRLNKGTTEITSYVVQLTGAIQEGFTLFLLKLLI